MRAGLTTFAKHVPMIKFPNRKIPHTADHSVKPHFFSNGALPSSISSSTKSNAPLSNENIELGPNDVKLRSELPLRFRYKPIEEIEIEDVNFGGAEILIK